MTTVTGLYKGFEKNDAGFITCIIENTGLEVQPGTRTKYFNHGKVAPKTASGATVEFEYTSKDYENGKTYYTVKGPLKEVARARAAPSVVISSYNSASNDPRQGSIEIQSSIASASRVVAAAVASKQLDFADAASAIAELVKHSLSLLHPVPKAAPTPKSKPAPKDEIEDDDIPY